ncbi:MAG: AMP-binding protein [Nitrospinae bacterium]|nr:AMP-binding protein [Nitrospinota bacterium]
MSFAVNIASVFAQTAQRLGDKPAVHLPSGRDGGGKVIYKTWTFRQLNQESDALAHGLTAAGIGEGTRTLLMAPPGFNFIALSFALFKVGAVPVLIDPGMGKINLLNCVEQAAPEAMIAIPKAHFARLLYPARFRSVKTFITVGIRWLWGGLSMNGLRGKGQGEYPIAPVSEETVAAILFTTGSTGPPKGVVYTHGVFAAQTQLIRDQYGVTDADVDLPAFPLFALFSTALGMCVVIPDMDPTRPGSVDPRKIVEAIHAKSVTFTFGSPAIWRRVSGHCADNGIKLPTLKKVLMAGAPVPNYIHERLLNGVLAPDGTTHTPFGATESLPVCDITGREVLDETAAMTRQGMGVCVGRPVRGVTVEIMAINDGAVEAWDDSLKLAAGETGEIVVSGPVVTKSYFRMEEATRKAKIYDSKSGVVRHRMGDVGYLDDKGRLWFCGRVAHRVITRNATLFTIPCEAIFNDHPDVMRTALVGLGDPPAQTPALIVEMDPARPARVMKAVEKELLELGAANPVTAQIKTILFHPGFPTDIRHNAKIFREKLKVWAEAQRPDMVSKRS